MSTVTTAEARKLFSDLVNRANYSGERIVITRHGKGVVALVPINDLEHLEQIEDEADIRMADKAMQDVFDGKSELLLFEEVISNLKAEAKNENR